ncbi:unnamed protein product [Prunus armeniaca]|uniref:Fungal lipase-type domain-containing protein n=1 Tax=Prunus armeniaca TaxID=36596 RepID=A0A6J5VEE7_PRUAR|nr:unnamed protein product [Prunus armeniaca]
MSAIGYTDKRVKLDKTISRKDSKYYGALSAMAAKIAYENEAFIKNTVENHWKMELIEFNNFWNDAWSTDFDISWFDYGPLGKVHGGFMNALGLTEKEGLPKELKQDNHHPLAYYTIRRHLRNLVRLDNNTKFIVTGHSLGGALAILFTALLALHDEELLLKRLEGVYTFGQPRVGDEVFQKFMEKQTEVHDIKYHRIVYGNDLVPRVPSDNPTFLFKHFGTCLYYNSFYKQKALEEEPNKNYFDPTAAMSKHLTAIWELIRSFIIPYAEGPEYKESWLLKAIRVFGVIIPGVAAHNPQDYVNATRLG